MKGRVIFYLLMTLLVANVCYCLFAPEFNPLVLVCAILGCAILTILLYIFVIRPIRAVENGMNLLRAQDYASRLRSVGQRDADNIVSLFNDLMERLKNERLRLEEQNLFLQQLIDASTQGIVIMDFNGKPMQSNPAAKAMLAEIEIPELKERESKTLRSQSGMIYKVQRLSFLDRGHRHTFYLIESLTEELRQAEREAYGRVIRTIAHEVNNTMGGINTVMQVVGATTTDRDIAETIDSCTERAEKMTQFISSYASLVKIPDPQVQTIDLADSFAPMRQFIVTNCAQAGIELQWRTDESCRVKIDPILWEQVVVNIIKNSIESIKANGNHDGKIVIETSADGTVRIVDNGTGISDEVVPQIFTPFFTTKPQGQGIGLMLISEVLRRHGCQFSLSTDKATGLTTLIIHFEPQISGL